MGNGINMVLEAQWQYSFSTMKVFVVLLLALASASAGILPKLTPVHPKDMKRSGSIQGRITNGQAAAEGQFP